MSGYGDPIWWRSGQDPDAPDPADVDGPMVSIGAITEHGVVHGVPAIAEPYWPQAEPAWWKRLLIATVFRRWRCTANWRCTWPATEAGGTCDRHDPAYGAHYPGRGDQ